MTAAERQRVDMALQRAQAGTTSHLAVRIIPDASVDAFERAKREFIARGLHDRAAANSALILVAPNARAFAVIGDRALHERVGQTFWDETVAHMSRAFKTRSAADAIVIGIDRLGGAFHEHFAQAAS